jgi:hypothetical protein
MPNASGRAADAKVQRASNGSVMKMLRCRQWAISLGLMGAGIGLMIFNLGVTAGPLLLPARIVFIGAGAGLGWFLVGRIALAGVRLREDGLEIRGPFTHRVLRWDDIESFHLARWTVLPRLGQARLRDGSRVPLFGIQEIRSAFNQGDRQAHDIVATLNERLEAQPA